MTAFKSLFYDAFRVCALFVCLICVTPHGQAHAESPYSRDQVENHLRAMFVDTGPTQPNFDFMSNKKVMRFFMTGLQDDELQSSKVVFKELFSDLLNIPARGVQPTIHNIDLLVILTDDIKQDGMVPAYKSWLKLEGESEESYLERLRSDKASDIRFVTSKYIRSPGDHFVVIAMQRLTSYTGSHYSYGDHLRFALFHAFTGARMSEGIKPSITNPPFVEHRSASFASIDQAVLRAIFNHQDWGEMDFEAQIQTLTDRVMAELSGNS